MSPGEFEAAIWDAMRRHNVTTITPAGFVDDLLRAGLAFAAGDSDDVTLRRRQVVVRDGWRHVTQVPSDTRDDPPQTLAWGPGRSHA